MQTVNGDRFLTGARVGGSVIRGLFEETIQFQPLRRLPAQIASAHRSVASVPDVSFSVAREEWIDLPEIPTHSHGMVELAAHSEGRIANSREHSGEKAALVHPKNLREGDSGAAVQCGSRTETARKIREQRLTAFLSSR